MQVFSDDGARIDVRIDGSDGDPIVLIAGFPLTRDIWNSQAEALSRTHRTIRPDLRGTGKSSVPEGPYLMEVLASDVAVALDALGIERTAIAGHSLGGYVALAFARMFAERVSHLALVCSRLAADSPERAATRRELADRAEAAGSVDLVTAAYVPLLLAQESSRVRPDLAVRSARNGRRFRSASGGRTAPRHVAAAGLRRFAADLDIPVLVVAGALDAAIPLAEARAMADAFPRGRLVVCENSGHLPMLEEPEKVTAALTALVSE